MIASISRGDLYGQTLDLGGPEVLSYEQLFEFFAAARGITKPRLKIPKPLLQPVVGVVGAVMSNPIITVDELTTLGAEAIAGNLDAVLTNFEFRPSSPSAWAQTHWRSRRTA